MYVYLFCICIIVISTFLAQNDPARVVVLQQSKMNYKPNNFRAVRAFFLMNDC